jgi:hypothetical protein
LLPLLLPPLLMLPQLLLLLLLLLLLVLLFSTMQHARPAFTKLYYHCIWLHCCNQLADVLC